MKVMGFDPGANTGVCLLEAEPRGRFAWRHHGVYREEILDVLATLLEAHRPDLVAVETPEGYIHEHKRGRDLLAAAVLAGELAGRAHAMGYRVEKASPQLWRSMLCSDGSAKDPAIKAMVLVRAREVPRQTSSHARDAACVAMFCAMRAGRARR